MLANVGMTIPIVMIKSPSGIGFIGLDAMKLLFNIILIGMTLFSLHANAQINPLSIEQAYQFSVEKTQTDSIIAKWQIAPGYYLYKDRFKFIIKSPQQAMLGKIKMPEGIKKHFPTLGTDEVYKHNINLAIPILNPTTEKLSLLVTYQGCADSGFCYPPTTKLVTLDTTPGLFNQKVEITDYQTPQLAKKVTTIEPAKKQLSAQDEATALLSSGGSALVLLIFFGFGLLLTFTPCVLPMIPILSGIIVGHGHKISTRKAFSLSLVYVLSMALTYAIVGVLVGLLGSGIQAAMQVPWVIVSFSVIFILLSLSLFGFYELRLPTAFEERIANLSHSQHGGHYLSVAIMGCLATLIVSPCVTAPLVGALAYIGNTGDAVFGGLALFMLGLGMGVPLLIIGSAHGKLLPKAGIWMNTVKSIFGVMMLGLAIWMLDRILPGQITLFLWACLFVISAIYMGAVSTTPAGGWGKLWKGLGIIFLTYGLLMIIGAGMGNSNPFMPLSFQHLARADSPTQLKLNFKRVKSVADVKREIALAKVQNKSVMLDFYADWCIACKEIEHAVFNNPDVVNMLKSVVLIQADVTANDDVDKALERYYNVVAPPTIIFFDKQGNEMKNKRIVGDISVQAFIKNWQKS